jgi:hypothetical protein
MSVPVQIHGWNGHFEAARGDPSHRECEDKGERYRQFAITAAQHRQISIDAAGVAKDVIEKRS